MTPDEIKANYSDAMDRVGEDISIRRFSGSGASRTSTDYAVRARVVGFEPHELVGGILQGDRKVIALAEDLATAGISLPVTTNDSIVARGREMRIIAADDNTRRVQGTLIALEIQVRG